MTPLLRRIFAAIAICTLAFSLRADHPVSSVVYGAAPGAEAPIGIATDGRNFLVLWISTQNSALYATRVSGNGVRLDNTGIILARNVGNGVGFWNGSQWVVVWDEPNTQRLLSSRISLDGRTITAPAVVTQGALLGDNRATSWNGRNAPVVITRGTGNFNVAFVDRDGAIASETQLPAGTAMRQHPALATNGTEQLVGWIESSAIYGVRVGAEGQLLDTSPRLLASRASTGSGPLMASDGADFLLITTGESGTGLEARKITRAGEPQPANAIPMPAGAGTSPTLTWAKTAYALAYAGTSGNMDRVYGLALDRDGKGSTIETLIEGSWRMGVPLLAHNGSTLYLAWRDGRVNEGGSAAADVFGRLLGGLTIDTLLSVTATQQQSPSIATDTTGIALVAWTEERFGGGHDVWAARLRRDGTRMDGRGLRLSRSDSDNAFPRVIYDGLNFVVAWVSTIGPRASYVVTSRISRDGFILDVGGIHQYSAEGCVSGLDLIAVSPSPVVVWGDCPSGRIRAARVTTTGGIMSSEGEKAANLTTIVSPAGMRAQRPSVAFDGSAFLVAWEEVLSPTTRNIRAARLTRELALLDPLAIDVANATEAYGPSVASAGQEFVVAWEERGAIVYRHIAHSGAPLTPKTELARGRVPRVIRDPAGAYFMAWEETSTSLDLTGTRVARSNGVAAADRFTIAATELPDKTIALTGSLGIIAVYERLSMDRAHGGVYRVFMQEVLAPVAPPTRRKSVR